MAHAALSGHGVLTLSGCDMKANHVDEIEREHAGAEAPDRDVGITMDFRCQHTGYGSQPPEDPDQPAAGEEHRHKDSQSIDAAGVIGK